MAKKQSQKQKDKMKEKMEGDVAVTIVPNQPTHALYPNPGAALRPNFLEGSAQSDLGNDISFCR